MNKPSANQNPEQKARDRIDKQLIAAGWLVQDKKSINLNAGPGIAVREYQTDVGPADYVPTTERATRKLPMLLTAGRILSQYNVGAQTRRTENQTWHDQDFLKLHPHDAEERGINDGDWVGLTSRAGDTVLQAKISTRMQTGPNRHHLSPGLVGASCPQALPQAFMPAAKPGTGAA